MLMRKMLSVWCIFATSLFLSFELTHVETAMAFASRRLTGTYCVPFNNWDGSYMHASVNNTSTATAGGRGTVINNSGGLGWSRISLVCSAESDTELPHAAVTLVNIHGIDGDTGSQGYVKAQLCADYFDWDGFSVFTGTCSSYLYSGPDPGSADSSRSFQGSYTITFGGPSSPAQTTAWTTNPAGFPYIFVDLPGRGDAANGGQGYSSVIGYYLEHTP
jgi:hypothetical protein